MRTGNWPTALLLFLFVSTLLLTFALAQPIPSPTPTPSPTSSAPAAAPTPAPAPAPAPSAPPTSTSTSTSTSTPTSAPTTSASASTQPSASATGECDTLFSGVSSATSTTAANTAALAALGLTTTISSNAISASLIALIISFDVVGIGYVISKLVPSSKVRGWLGKEYWEVAKSAILVGLIFSLLTFMSSIGVILTGGSPGTYMTNVQGLVSSSESYLCTVNSQTNLAITHIVPLFIGIGFFKGISIDYPGFPIPPVPLKGWLAFIPAFRAGIQFSLFANILYGVEYVFLTFNLSLFLDTILFLFFPVKVFYAAQVLILPYLVSIGLVALIPTGLILRAFPFTRGIGGTLIAFGIGVAIIWPSLLILFNAPISNDFCNALSPNFCTPIGPSWTADSQAIPFNNFVTAAQICNNIFSGTAAATSTPSSSYPGSGLFSVFCTPVADYWVSIGGNELGTSFQTLNSLYPSLNVILNNSFYLILQIFVLSVFDILIAYTLTDNIAKMLGGTIKLSLGNKLKLV